MPPIIKIKVPEHMRKHKAPAQPAPATARRIIKIKIPEHLRKKVKLEDEDEEDKAQAVAAILASMASGRGRDDTSPSSSPESGSDNRMKVEEVNEEKRQEAAPPLRRSSRLMAKARAAGM